MPEDDLPPQATQNTVARRNCQAINRRGEACKSPAMPRSNFCTHHTPTITKAVKGASRGAAGTAGYIAGLLSGAASSDFFEYLKDRTGYKHFFPPVKGDRLSFDEIEIGSTDYEPRAVVRCLLEKVGSDFLFESRHDIDWVLDGTIYSFFPIEYEIRPKKMSIITGVMEAAKSFFPIELESRSKRASRIKGFLEAAKPLISNGNAAIVSHLLFIHSLGQCRYVGKVSAGWLGVEIQEKLVLHAFSGKGWDGDRAWRDTHVYDVEKGVFVETERQVRGYFMDGIFRPEYQ